MGTIRLPAMGSQPAVWATCAACVAERLQAPPLCSHICFTPTMPICGRTRFRRGSRSTTARSATTPPRIGKGKQQYLDALFVLQQIAHRSRIPSKSNKIVGRNFFHSIQVYTHVHQFPSRLTPVKGPPNLCSKKPVPT